MVVYFDYLDKLCKSYNYQENNHIFRVINKNIAYVLNSLYIKVIEI